MKKRFHKINIEITNICNLQCSFCPEVIRTKKTMELELFRKIIPQVAPITEQVCFHLMGEPLVHPRLKEMLEICAEHQVPVFMVSNGVLLTEARAETLLHPTIRQVNFSLHAYPDNHPDRDVEPYLEKIFQFTERALKERPELYVNYRLWNLQSVDDQSSAKIEKNKEMLTRISKRFQVDESQLWNPSDVRTGKSRNVTGRLYLHYDTEFVWPSPDLPVIGEVGTCKGLSQHFGILAEGTVVPCCLDKEGNIPLGQVQDQSIEEILSSPRAKKILEGFRNRKLLESMCQRCQYVQRFS